MVEWVRVAATLGSLAGFQVLYGIAALFYCGGNLEVVDDVSTISSMFIAFHAYSEEGRWQEGGTMYRGRFIREGDRYRWVTEAISMNVKGT